ncbi:SGNH hydrolase-type esterase domain protein, partial [Vibrio phage 1.104.O._10N.286.49.A12]
LSYLERISNSINGSQSIFNTIGWLGDSITANNFLGPTGEGQENRKYGFASIVSEYYGALMDNQAESGRNLSSFLPVQSGSVGSAVKNFDGEWLNDSGSWYWWDPEASSGSGAWVFVVNNGSSVDRNGSSVSRLDSLISNTEASHIVISQTGVNDNDSNTDAGVGDNGAHGSRHYGLLLTEIIKRLRAARKTILIVTGLTASSEQFHGLGGDYLQRVLGRYSEVSRHIAYNFGLNCCDTGVRLNLEIATGRVDILTRSSQVKPENQTQLEWDAYLASTGDPNAATNAYRVFDETEDYLHIEDSNRIDFWFNLHPNALGHYLNANEIIKYINERGFV